MNVASWSLFVVLAAVGCKARNAGPHDATPPVAPTVVASASPPVLMTPSAAPPARALPSARLGVVITVTGPGEVAIESSGVVVGLATAARIEQQDADGTFRDLATIYPSATYRLVERCDAQPASCFDLAPPKVLRPVRFTAGISNSQCGLGFRGTSEHPKHTRRIVISACDGGATLASPTFDIPDFSGDAAVERLWAAEGITEVVAMRLDLARGPVAVSGSADPRRVVGFDVRAGSPRPVDTELRAALAEALRGPRGFDDSTLERRCAMKHLVGFRVTRSLPTTGIAPKSQVNEIAIDFNCQKIFVVRGEEAPRAVHASHFDPSRPAFLSLVRKTFPDDSEITALR